MKAQYKNNDTVTRTMNSKCHRTTKNTEYTARNKEQSFQTFFFSVSYGDVVSLFVLATTAILKNCEAPGRSEEDLDKSQSIRVHFQVQTGGSICCSC
jgi:hypothetical protein